MNEEAGMKSFKSLIDQAGGFKQYIDNLANFVRKSEASDQTNEAIEFELKKLSLLMEEPQEKHSEPKEEPVNLLEIYSQIQKENPLK